MSFPLTRVITFIFSWIRIKESFVPQMSDFCILYMNERGWESVPLLTSQVGVRLAHEAYCRAKNVKGAVYYGRYVRSLEEVAEAVYQYHCSETDDVRVKEILSFHDKSR
jgi:hypothetical protein